MFNNISEKEIEEMLARERGPQVARVKFKPIEPVSMAKAKPRPIETLGDVNVCIDVQLATTQLTVKEVLELEEGSVVELDRVAGEPVDVFVNQKAFASGEVAVINEFYGVRINSLVDNQMEKEE